EQLEGRWALWAPDLPGHGANPLAPGFRPTRQALAASLGAALSTLAIPWALALGHSAGAAILLQHRLETPARARSPLPLGLLAPVLLPLAGLQRWLFPAAAAVLARYPSLLSRLVARSTPERLARRLIADTGSTLPRAQLQGYADLLAQRSHGEGALALMRHWDLRSLTSALAKVQDPLLILTGTEDRTYPRPPRAALEPYLPSAAWRSFPGLGHLLHEEAPAEVGAAITGWALGDAPKKMTS
ncbi:MAG: alpha/beta fold hydrolase, partial [Pseudomonadota bacterium]|nr:alpha/beta fold hydrolase [Pseudomonadota bacterium]